MDYIKDSIKFIRENPKRALLIFLLDICFYLLFLPIFNLFAALFFRQRMPMKTMGAVMQSMEIESLRALQAKLAGIFIGIILTISLFFLLVLLNIAVLKSIIWVLTVKKKIDWKILLKGALLTLVLALIFIIPFIASLFPFFAYAKSYSALSPVIDVKFTDFIPVIIAIFAIYYFFNLGFYFLAKESSFKKAFKNTFKVGVLKFHRLALPFIAFFAINAAILKLLKNFNIMFIWGIIVFLLFVIVISFFNRVYLNKSA